MTNSNRDDHDNPLHRRDFLKLAGGAALGGAALGLPGTAGADHSFTLNPHWSSDKIWKEVRKAFVLDSDSVYMNIGTTGSMPCGSPPTCSTTRRTWRAWWGPCATFSTR